MAKNGKNKEQKGGFWNFIDNIEGDKVVWIIVFMLTMISALAIFSLMMSIRLHLFRTNSTS